MTSPLEILAIKESKLDDSFIDGEISIPGYTIVRKARKRYEGGVALYVRENLSYTIREDLVPARLDMIWVEINLPYNRSFLVSTWYTDRQASAAIDLFVEYSSFIKKCDCENKEPLILGDMNCDYLKDAIEPHTRKFQFLLSVYQLKQLHDFRANTCNR